MSPDGRPKVELLTRRDFDGKSRSGFTAYSALASKWEFEQMGIWPQNSLQVIREQMGIRANGNVPRKIMHND